MVLGKVIGNFLIDLIARKAKAWDSIKSPLILNLSINFKLILLGRFFFIPSTRILFFRPPPQIKMSIELAFAKNDDKESPKILAVNSVKVAAPSSIESPLVKDMSKSLVSNETLFLFFLFALVKAIVPRYRYDQLMRLGWKIFLPFSLIYLVLTASFLFYFDKLPKGNF